MDLDPEAAPRGEPEARPAGAALRHNLRAGLRCACFLRADVVATWEQAGILLALNALSIVFWEWVVAGFPLQFDPTGLPGAFFGLLLAWAAACAIAALNRTPARALDLAVHVGKLPADTLRIRHRLAKNRALLDVANRFVERPFGQAE